jgi:hypothetical protein
VTDDDFGVQGINVAVGGYRVHCVPRGLPALYGEMASRAELVDAFDLQDSDLCCFAVSRVGSGWPFLVVAQSFSPAGVGFEPGILLAPDTDRLFVGAGERLLAYDLASAKRLWLDSTDMGFLGWARHDDIVLLTAKLELAAWSTSGEKLWSTFAEPPWEYSVEDGTVLLDVMGEKSRFDVRRGPREPTR